MKITPVLSHTTILRYLENGHAIVAEARNGSPAIALDHNGYEYAVGCGARKTSSGGLEWWDSGRITHVADSIHAPVWRSLAATDAPNHNVTVDDVRKRHGIETTRMLRLWIDQGAAWLKKSSGKPPMWLVLYGNAGCGKTSTARWLQRELAGCGVHAAFIPWRELVEAGRAARHEGKPEPKCEGKIVIIDDVGADNASAYAAELLYDVTDRAEQTGQVVVITSNVTPADLLAQYRADGPGANHNATRAVDRINRRSRVVTMNVASTC